MMKGEIIGIIVMAIVGGLILYQAGIAIYRKFALRYKITVDEAKVVAKYSGNKTTRKVAARTNGLGFDEEYDVYILYKGKEFCIEDEDLYRQVNVGDIVQVDIHEGFNKKSKLKRRYLSIRSNIIPL